MRFVATITLLLAIASPLALAKDKKPGLSAVFNTARFVYVQSEDGDIMKPGLYPEDREAIANVEDALRDWNRYVITLNRKDADLVIIVRKGRLVAAQGQGNIALGNPPQIGGATYPGHNPAGPGNTGPGSTSPDRTASTAEGIGARGEAGPSDDLLRVFMTTPEGKLSGPLWSREQKDGLDAPNVRLLAALKDAVNRAYPPQPATQPTSPAKP